MGWSFSFAGSPHIVRRAGMFMPGRGAPRAALAAASASSPRTVATTSRSRPTSSPTGSDQIWGTDITCIPTDEGWLYVAGVLDL
jgi:hypothetical protein